MNFQVLREYLPYFLEGALAAVRVAAVGTTALLAVGFVCVITRYLDVPVAKCAVGLYIEPSRSTSLITQFSLIHYGLPEAGIILSFEALAIIGLNFLGGGHMAEAFRSGFDSAGMIQWGSAQSLGMAHVNAMIYVTIPQAFSRSVTALVANVTFLVKETSIVFVIVPNNLVHVAQEKIGNDYDTTEALLFLVAFYIAIILPVFPTGAYPERRARRTEFGN